MLNDIFRVAVAVFMFRCCNKKILVCMVWYGCLFQGSHTLNTRLNIRELPIWSEWRLTVIAATVRIALVDILDLSEVDIPAGVFLHPAVGWG